MNDISCDFPALGGRVYYHGPAIKVVDGGRGFLSRLSEKLRTPPRRSVSGRAPERLYD